MNEKYYIQIWLDSTWGVYRKEDGELLFKGSLSDVNAWMDLNAKGFDL